MDLSDDTTLYGVIGGGAAVVLLLVLCCCCCCCRTRKSKSATKAESAGSKHPTGDAHAPQHAIDVTERSHQSNGAPRAPYTPMGTPQAKYDRKQSKQSNAPLSPTATATTTAGSRHYTPQHYTPQQYTGQQYVSDQYAPQHYTPPKAGNDAVALAEDPAIIASRLPYETIMTLVLISRGGFGEVYKGSYRGNVVAIKKLLPESRRDLKQINAFLGEVKLMASLDHERIVRFIGVAWDALSDVCVVSEFMEGGDLRSTLTRWEEVERRPHGIDKQKATLALHVAHALTYMHSLQPVVLHRDLKSKNILLDETLGSAKLTDFGVSRERSDNTMTAAVGTLLWMAPEVMAGDRYDDKADIFSFGIVLSELDTHQLPYADVKAKMINDTGRPLPDTALLQRIMSGRVTVGFSAALRDDIRALGQWCVAVDPADRPAASQVLYELHKIVQTFADQDEYSL